MTFGDVPRNEVLCLLIACGTVVFLVALVFIVAIIKSHIDCRDEKKIKAKWLPYGEEPFVTWKCSNCGETFDEIYNYCPECGKEMEG